MEDIPDGVRDGVSEMNPITRKSTGSRWRNMTVSIEREMKQECR
jgi:hypothetical protein